MTTNFWTVGNSFSLYGKQQPRHSANDLLPCCKIILSKCITVIKWQLYRTIPLIIFLNPILLHLPLITFNLLLSPSSNSSAISYFYSHKQMISCLLICSHLSSPPSGYVAYFLSVLCASRWDEFKIRTDRQIHVTVLHCSFDTQMHRDASFKKP